MIPGLASEIDRHQVRVHPPQLRRRDHILALDLEDERHTHLDWPDGPAVLHTRHIDARGVTVVALLVRYGGEPARELPDDAWVTVYRPQRGGAA